MELLSIIKTYFIIIVNSLIKQENKTTQRFIGMKKAEVLDFQGDYYIIP